MRTIAIAISLSLSACHVAPDRSLSPAVTTIDTPDTVIPFEMTTGRPIVQVLINGEGPYPFIFDTGSPILVLLGPLADDLNMDVTGSTEVGSPAGGTPVPADLVLVESLTLGDVKLSDIEATSLFIEGLPAEAGMGVIGPALFRDHGRVTIDFKTNTILIGGEIDSSKITTWMPIDTNELHLNAPARIGDVIIPGHIDTGTPAVLSVPNQYESQLPLDGPVRSIGTARVVDAEFEIRSASIEAEVLVGDVILPLTEITFSSFPVANLGSAGLRGTRLDIDWVNNRFAMTGRATPIVGGPQRRIIAGEPASGPVIQRMQEPSGGGPRFGLQAAPPGDDDTMQVHGIEEGSPAEEIGLLAGDRIIKINNVSPGELGMDSIRAALAAQPLELVVIREGEEVLISKPKL